jgi:OHCU decarboxylase
MAMITLAEVNGLDREAFVACLGFLFEGSPWIAAEAWSRRPFRDAAHLHQSMCDVMCAATDERKLALIMAHPDLVGRAALAGTLTPESTREQAAAGLDALSPDESVAFQQYNAAYRERFGFPFVICARHNKKDSILAGFASRLAHSRDQEIVTALDEIAKISKLRLIDHVVPEDGPGA